MEEGEDQEDEKDDEREDGQLSILLPAMIQRLPSVHIRRVDRVELTLGRPERQHLLNHTLPDHIMCVQKSGRLLAKPLNIETKKNGKRKAKLDKARKLRGRH